MGEVIEASIITTLPTDPDRILRNAIGKMNRVLVIGIDNSGNEFFASSDPDGGTALWGMERAKLKLLRTVDEGK